jgi:hypothetical protein
MSVTNPAMMLPGMNPSGSSVSLSPWASSGSVSSTANPYAPVMTTGGTGTIPGASPYNSTSPASGLLPFQSTGGPTSGTGTPVPLSGTATGAGSPTVTNSSAGATTPSSAGAALGVPTTTGGENKLLQSLNKAYGSGMGTMLYNFLAGGAGYNQTAVNNLIASLQPGYEQDQQNLLSAFSAGGNRFGSGAQIGEATLEGQEQLNIGQLETQMYEQSVSDYINVMMGAASGSNARKMQSSAASSGLINTLIQAGTSTAGAMVG